MLEVYTDSGWTPLAEKPVDIHVANKYITTVKTDANGAYEVQATIQNPGEHTLKSEFKGEEVEDKKLPIIPLLLLLGAIIIVRK